MAMLGIVGGSLAAAWLCNDRFTSGTRAQLLQAGTVGPQLPFFGGVLFISLLIAVHATESVV